MDDRLPTLLPPSGAPTFLTPSAPSSSRQQYQQFLDVEEFQQLSKIANSQQQTSKYAQLLAVIEEMGRDVRPTYAGSKSSQERLKRSIVHARILVRECLMETERSGRQ
ncbi:cyclin-dependent kinase 2-associated protein 1 [Folsomia candida]|uniref:cyclin-dependent kinase 2-associated protein 1 n=1 Tax=Folsomia candida TaxID=158441 RepID=UPI000B8F710C|nr:cyclin-dependent kinase 2-associated protein 1 [Folsomia candida]